MNTRLMKASIGIAILALLASACGIVPVFGSRHLITETRQVSDFERVEVSGGGSLEIIQDGTESLSIETDDNIMPYVTCEVSEGLLRVGMDFGLRTYLPSRMHISLHVKDLSAITTSGAWKVTSPSVRGDTLSILTSGSGDMVIDELAVDDLETSISGTGSIDLTGEAKTETINISGSGKIETGDLRTQDVTVSISGTGTVTVWATRTLSVEVSGSGTVNYYGSPQVSFSQSGSGKVNHLGEK
jgi:hypothetical protein